MPTENPDLKLGVFCTGPAIRNLPNNFITEPVGTMVLLIGVGAIFGSASGGNLATSLGPHLVGALVWGHRPLLGRPYGVRHQPGR